MAMTIMNNTGAMLTLGQLNKNISKAGKELKKVSSGMKLNSAGDDASGYAISEKMRVRIRGLYQDEQNVKNGKALLHVAEGGIQNIVDELRSLKELALNSANDHNTDLDRVTIQKEFDSRKANINDIASETNYNGKILLDGRYGRKKLPNLTMSEPTGVTQTLSSGAVSITQDGVYIIPSGYSGDVTIASGVQNVEIRQENPGEVLHEVYIVGPSGGGANIWINGLNIQNTVDKSIIMFQGNNNYLTVIGNNTIKYTGTTDYDHAVINMGDGLTLEGTGTLSISNTGTLYSCAGIGVDENQTTPGNIVINSGTYDIFISHDGAGIGASYHSSMGDIIINGGTINTVTDTGAGIGSTGMPQQYITQNANNQVGNIVIGKNAVINAESNYGAGIGSGASYAHAASIKVSKDADVTAHSNHGEDIGKGYLGTVGNIDTDWDDSNIDYGQYTREIWQGNPLVIHHGTKANEAINVYINDMRTKALGIDSASVVTREEATLAIGIIDDAINYALDEITTMGAYISRLDFTEENIVTANESTQASESTIRDADMAKAMTEYTKSNVLAQASQSMLAQANQTSASVLSLLQ